MVKYEYVSIVWSRITGIYNIPAKPKGFEAEIKNTPLEGDTLNYLGSLGYKLREYQFIPATNEIIYIMERQIEEPVRIIAADGAAASPELLASLEGLTGQPWKQERPPAPADFIRQTEAQGFKWDSKLKEAIVNQAPAPEQPYTPTFFKQGRIHWHTAIRQQFVRAYLTNTIEPKSRADFTDRYESLRDGLLEYIGSWNEEDSFSYAGFMAVVEILNHLLNCLFTEQEIKEILF